MQCRKGCRSESIVLYCLRPRPHVSGFVCIRKHFVAVTLSVHTYPVKTPTVTVNFWKRSPEWKLLKTQQVRIRVDACNRNLLKTIMQINEFWYPPTVKFKVQPICTYARACVCLGDFLQKNGASDPNCCLNIYRDNFKYYRLYSIKYSNVKIPGAADYERMRATLVRLILSMPAARNVSVKRLNKRRQALPWRFWVRPGNSTCLL